MRRLVFIDDDEQELKDFATIVQGDYVYTPIHWPGQEVDLFRDPGPDIFVSDLYLPPSQGDKEPGTDEIITAERFSTHIAEIFSGLYKDSSVSHKERLRRTMGAIDEAYKLLQMQWSALGQSPDHGVSLLKKLKKHFPRIPLVFYSRKITPEDVIRVLRAGAVDAIRKGAWGKQDILARLGKAEDVWRDENLQRIKRHGYNPNITLIPGT